MSEWAAKRLAVAATVVFMGPGMGGAARADTTTATTADVSVTAGSGAGGAAVISGGAPETPPVPAAPPDPPPFDPGWNDQVPDLFKTVTPDSPAFVLLGIAPTDIQRPTTPQALAVSLAAFVDGTSSLSIPKNLALEVSPYWLFSHPMLTADKYESGGLRSLYRMLTISVGTHMSTQSVTLGGLMTDQNVSDLGVGVRTRLVDGDDYDQSCKAKLQSAAQDVSFAGILSDADMASLIQRYGFQNPELAAAVGAAKEKARATKLAALSSLTSECAKTLSARKGFSLDVAGGGAWRFPDGKISSAGQLLLAAGWLSGGYTWTNASLLGIGRFAHRSIEMDQKQSVGDVGLRSLYAANRFGASVEGIYRHRFSGGGIADTYRLDMTLETRVTDGSWLSVTFGKDFSTATAGSIFSLANLTWGFGDRKVDPSM